MLPVTVTGSAFDRKIVSVLPVPFLGRARSITPGTVSPLKVYGLFVISYSCTASFSRARKDQNQPQDTSIKCWSQGTSTSYMSPALSTCYPASNTYLQMLGRVTSTSAGKDM